MKYKVVLTARAEADLDRLLTSLRESSQRAALRLAARFSASLARLRNAPLGCGLDYEDRWFTEQVRHLLFGIRARRKYRALFVVRVDEVVILAIRAPGERPVSPNDLDDPSSPRSAS